VTNESVEGLPDDGTQEVPKRVEVFFGTGHAVVFAVQ
jgi:hypothetical protein